MQDAPMLPGNCPRTARLQFEGVRSFECLVLLEIVDCALICLKAQVERAFQRQGSTFAPGPEPSSGTQSS